MLVQPLSNVQEEILKLYSTNLDQGELIELKTILGKYFAQKATKEADKIWIRNNYSNDKMESWLNEE